MEVGYSDVVKSVWSEDVCLKNLSQEYFTLYISKECVCRHPSAVKPQASTEELAKQKFSLVGRKFPRSGSVAASHQKRRAIGSRHREIFGLLLATTQHNSSRRIEVTQNSQQALRSDSSRAIFGSSCIDI
jgi:hypothetical protein